MAKNQSITVTYTAWDTAAGAPKSGDASHHTIRGIRDGVLFTLDAEPEEVGYGEYRITLDADENTGDMMAIVGTSSTAGVVLVKASWQNAPGQVDIGAFAGLDLSTQAATALLHFFDVSTPACDINVIAQPGDTMALPLAERNAIADAIGGRGAANFEATADQVSLATVILAIAHSNTTAEPGYLTIYQSDGVTVFARIPLAADPAADPITGLG